MLVQEKKFIVAFGKRLKMFRLQKEMSQAELANTADIPSNQVGRIERGEINTTLTTVKVLADSLGIHISELFID